MRLSLVFVLLAALSAQAQTKLSIRGYFGADGRAFILPPKFPGQSWGHNVSLVADPVFELKIRNSHRLALEPFYRLDSVDERRSHWDIREASYRVSVGDWRIGLGAGRFSWGVLESYRPTDVINQTDFVESYDFSAKLGQPYIEATYAREKVSLSMYYFPFFRERTFPGLRGRPRFAVVVDNGRAEYETELGPWQPSGALRLALHGGGVDWGLAFFSGVSREPRFIVQLTSSEVAPRYDLTHRASTDLQWSYKGFTLKAEGYVALYSNALQVFGGGGIGIDYTFFGFVRSADLTLVAEFLFDTRSDDAPVTFFKHNAFAGIRIAANNTGDTEVLLGAIVDVLDGTSWARVGVTHRFDEHWRMSAGANLFFGQAGTLQGQFNGDHFGELRLAYAF